MVDEVVKPYSPAPAVVGLPRAARTAESDMNGTVPRPRTPPPEGEPRSAALPSSVEDWLASLSGPGALGALLGPSPAEQLRRGYGHTLREIAQQPVTWPRPRPPAGAGPSGRGEPRRRRRPSSSRARAARSTPRSASRPACTAAWASRCRPSPRGPDPDPSGDVSAPERAVPRGLARPLRQQPGEPRRRWTGCSRAGPRPATSSSPATGTGPSPRPTRIVRACGRSSSTRGRTIAAW